MRSFIGTFIFTFFIAVFILLMQFLWTYLDDLVGKGLGFDVLGKLMFYTSITFVPMAMPLAMLLSSLMCFGNLGEFYELVAMKASGISVWKIMRPLLIFAIIMSITAFIFSNNVLPVATLKSKTLLSDVRKQKMSFDIPEGMFYKGIDGYTIRAEKKGIDGSTLYDVLIYDHTEYKGNVKVTSADSATIALAPSQKEIVFTLYNGYNYNEVTDDKEYRTRRPFEKMKFAKQYISFDISDFDLTQSDGSSFKGHQSMLNISQLVVAIDSLENNATERRTSYKNSFRHRLQHLSSKDVINKNIKHKNTDIDTITVFKWPLLENFTQKEQKSIVNMSITAVNNQIDNIELNLNDFERQYKETSTSAAREILAQHSVSAVFLHRRSFRCYHTQRRTRTPNRNQCSILRDLLHHNHYKSTNCDSRRYTCILRRMAVVDNYIAYRNFPYHQSHHRLRIIRRRKLEKDFHKNF